MDFTQNKLTKAEWNTIEIPVIDAEQNILKLIIAGYHDNDIHTNENQSMYSFVKIDKTPETAMLLYKTYFDEAILTILKKYGKDTPLSIESYNIIMANGHLSGSELKTLKSADMIRVKNLEANINENRHRIYEFLLIDLFKDLMKNIYKKKQTYAFYLYTILQLQKATISHVNPHLLKIIEIAITYANSLTKTSEIITNAYHFIERNNYLLKYEDKTLFSHQKQLFKLFIADPDSKFTPKLILYTAPTGTGKTLSPIGLSESYRIIFVCVARHIGLALARAAISMEKKVAFAFGCETASDIRLHYFSAINYTIHRKSGGIGKVDNSVGNNVEIMICDAKSYITAMHYMLAFNSAENIIVYMDEPTITLDYDEHPLHETIHTNWAENRIPTVILSCATLPTQDELQPVFNGFKSKFDGATIHTITSYDCRKSIPILNKASQYVLPHYLYSEYRQLIKCAEYCEQNKTLLRYFDLREIIRFIEYVNDQGAIEDAHTIDTHFNGNITNITMNSLKEYYLVVLNHIDQDKWPSIYKYLLSTRKTRFAPNNKTIVRTHSLDTVKSANTPIRHINSASIISDNPPTKSAASHGIMLTTTDSYTLTDGPTIFLAEDVRKIGTFYIQQTNIAPSVFQAILEKIIKNNDIIKRIDLLEEAIVAKESNSTTKTTTNAKGSESKSKNNSDKLCKESHGFMNEINKLRKEIKLVALDPMYLPNTRPHQQIWAPNDTVCENAFISNIGEEMAKEIMMLDIDNDLKVLLLLGIGMFTDSPNPKYMEIMKALADEQRLFIIIASTDYIYGTNYQFCHGFIGKDLTRMTQQKTMQSMGRIGRNNIQQDYTIRFRDDNMIAALFEKQEINLEAINMRKLLCSE
jgi:hypothetical protein